MAYAIFQSLFNVKSSIEEEIKKLIRTRLETRRREFLLGGDISSLAEIEKRGGIFRDDGRPDDAVKIMTKYGANCFRLRLFVDPPRVDVVVNDLPYTVALAKRIKAAGAKLVLDFHYSDTWADPGKQLKPEAWKDLDFDSLVERVYNYTRECIEYFRNEGVLPDIVQPGNEITSGMLWPDGKLYDLGDTEQQWRRFTLLLKAAIQGIRDGSGGEEIKILIHIDRGGDWAGTRFFFENIERYNVTYDIIGLSYYPWWHGPISALRETLTNAARRFGKDIFIVETAYPYRYVDFSKVEYANPAYLGWQMSPEGQRKFLADLIFSVLQTPNDLGAGVLWWYPESIPVSGLDVWFGGSNALFDDKGNVLPAMQLFRLLR
ncbi:MAG: glycosyl hydrolase 53 family protein [Nitrososphaerota archaeon]|nr:arabinogalactan endo-1,4-beta-galactosidase [Candidatus Bathyarchaeota archaeon]MDW8048855.1 glycosyl hydrolase 53 family protein [Nitrososphaerota archaeon]